MCGLVGIFDPKNNITIEQKAALYRAGSLLHHRGPDERTAVSYEHFSIHFQRLSIVDVANGSQPFISEDGRYVLAMIGEIYNYEELRSKLRCEHRFSSSSDIEVLLHLYEEIGVSAINELRGMYAGCLYDRREKRLLLIRDRLGIKPLFWAKTEDNTIVFASELKGIWAYPGLNFGFDWEAALSHTLLTEEYALRTSEPCSFFSGIFPVPPATVLSFERAGCTPHSHCYWTIEHNGDHQHSVADLDFVERYRATLQSAVHETIPREVPWAIFLSGGLDSSSAAAIAAHQGHQLRAFTVHSQGTDATSDYAYAKLLAEELNLDWSSLKIEDSRACCSVEEWVNLLWHTENPTTNVEQLYKIMLYRAVQERYPEIKVVLSGQGSDEFNGGYSIMLSCPQGQPSWKGVLAQLGRFRQSQPHFASFWQDSLGLSFNYAIKISDERYRLLDDWSYYLKCKQRDLHDYNLWHEDRIAAAVSIENRVPFLDHRLVELSYALSQSSNSELLYDKAVLRKAMKGIVPDQLRLRSKQPFFQPKDPRTTYDWAHELLLKPSANLIEHTYSVNKAMLEILPKQNLHRVLNSAKTSCANLYPIVLKFLNMAIIETLAKTASTRAAALPVPHPLLMADAA